MRGTRRNSRAELYYFLLVGDLSILPVLIRLHFFHIFDPGETLYSGLSAALSMNLESYALSSQLLYTLLSDPCIVVLNLCLQLGEDVLLA